jgi:hypothetical protein
MSEMKLQTRDLTAVEPEYALWESADVLEQNVLLMVATLRMFEADCPRMVTTVLPRLEASLKLWLVSRQGMLDASLEPASKTECGLAPLVDASNRARR